MNISADLLSIDREALSEEERQVYDILCSGIDPVYFMKNFVKIRSQPDTDDDDIDEERVPSRIELFNPWGAQLEVIDALIADHWVLGPKSRKIGFTTVGVGFGVWVQRFFESSRIHYISRRDDASRNLLERHIFSYRQLPEFMRLPIVQRNQHSFIVMGPRGDERIVQAYPATEDTAIEETADYTLLDEFASIKEPLCSRLWSGIEPTIAPDGYVLIISRGKGPQGTFATLVRRAALEAGIVREDEL